LLNEQELAEVKAKMSELTAIAEGKNVEAIKAALTRLTEATEEFAARRMDRSIRQALAGQSIDQLNI
jgi:molecular chaperone HscA